MRSAQKSGRKSGRRRKSLEATSDLSAASAAAEKKRREKPARAVARHPDAVSPPSPVSHTPQTHAADGLRSRNAAVGSVGKPARGRRKQARKSERTDRCPDPDTTQRHARVTPSPRGSARSRGSRTAKETHATLSPPRDTPLSSPKSEPGEETPRRLRGRPPKPRLSSTPQRRTTPPSLPQISPVTKTQSDASVRSQNPEARKRSRSKKAEQEVRETPSVKRQRKKRAAKAEPPQTQRIRTRFILEDSELREPEESLSSSGLSIELSVQEEKLPLAHTLALEDEEEELHAANDDPGKKPKVVSMRSAQKSGRRRKSSEATSDLSAASAAAEKKRRGKAARAVARHPDAVSPPSPVSHTPQTHAADRLRSRNAAVGSVGKPARGRRKQARKSERTDRCPDPDTTQRHARVTPSPRGSARSRGSRTAKETHATLSPPRDTPLSSPKSEPGEETPRRLRGRPPKPRLSSTPQRRTTPPSLPQISPVTKTQSDKSIRSQNPEARKRSRSKKAEQEVRETPSVKRQRKKRAAKAEPPQTQRIRTRFVLEDSELREPDESLSSSDLSIELSVQEEKLPLAHTLALEDEDEEEEEEEELPSFLQQIRQKSSSIREGLCVWYKLRKYPFWPAVVKRVNHKTKKASIVFIDHVLFDKKTISKGFSVSLRTLKPFDCEESHHFVDMAKEVKGEHIVLCLALISDYNIRIGCGSFVGSFLDYVADDISQPLRREILRASSDFLSPTQSLMEQQNGDSELQDLEEHPNLLQNLHMRQKVLPDRTLALRNRNNQRLVDFIIKTKGAQDRLLAVIRGNQESRWLQSLRSCSRASVEQVYLEDEKQFYAVYHYLEELLHSAAKANRHLEKSDPIRYILDVLFPEALILAISKMDSISLDKAEKIYRQGPQHSNRERQEFDLLIEQQMYLAAADSL